MRLVLPFAASVVACGFALGSPQRAEACGGTFCDNLPQPMPIDQSGENILFVVDGPNVEAHIQITIDSNTDAAKFAWVIPVATLPQFEIGSDPLFNSLLAASVPRYRTFEEGECGPGFDDGIGFIRDPDGGGVSVEVELHEVVGALEITVLSGGDAEEIVQWLTLNDYAQDDNALPIIEEYVAQGWMFAAVKLANNVGVDDVHPLVMRYDNGDPCVPLRLTAIAAKEDMEVRTFFLGDERVAPTNYKHVLVNPLKIDWLNDGANYKEVVTLAVDQDGANGKAFVTEFAGDSAAINRFGIWDEDWNATEFMRLKPEQVLGVLAQQGLGVCGPGFCQFNHPLVLGLLRKYLPAPADMDEIEFWGDIELNVALIDEAAWDGLGFATDLRDRIIDPGFHAIELLDTWPYLTRLYTTISPGEMTVDPIFHPHPDLPPVAAIRNAIRDFRCEYDGGSVVTLPDGREVYLPPDTDWPDFGDEMPWEEDVEELMEGIGAPIPIVDNTELIDQLLAEWNAANTPPPGGSDGGDGPGDGADDGAGTTGGSGGVDFPTGGGDDAGQGGIDGLSSGCACQSGRGVGGTVGFGLGLLLAGLATRRRRAPVRKQASPLPS